MKSFFLALFLGLLDMRSGNAKPIPPEMVGDWRYLDGMIEIRVDGFAYVGSSIGAACFATYESENVLKLDPRPRPGEIGEGTPKLPEFIVGYDPKTLTMTLSLEGEPTKKLGPYKRLTPTVYPDFEKVPLASLPPHWNG